MTKAKRVRLRRLMIERICLVFALPMVIGLIIHSTFDDTNIVVEKNVEYEIINPYVESVVEEPFYYDVPLSNEMQDYVRHKCEVLDIPMELVLAVMKCESNFNPNLISSTNDYGIMQVNQVHKPYALEQFGITDLLDIESNITYATNLLANHYHKHDTMRMALMAYNFGEGGAKRLWDKGVYTSAYAEKVVGVYETYRMSAESS